MEEKLRTIKVAAERDALSTGNTFIKFNVLLQVLSQQKLISMLESQRDLLEAKHKLVEQEVVDLRKMLSTSTDATKQSK